MQEEECVPTCTKAWGSLCLARCPVKPSSDKLFLFISKAMAILISPTNNTGWGLGTHKLFGGAKQKSDQHPVYVQAHYRASWGSKGRRRRQGRARGAPLDPKTEAEMVATIDEVARNGPPAARLVLEAARRVGAYNLRRARKLTPAGRAMMAMRARQMVKQAKKRKRRVRFRQ
ncbi:protein VII precursor [Canine adenovirus 2]|nr:protein VII precursor [Canine adenovirus 2]QJS39026.1 pVII [Canine adenovirus 2]UZP80960.1 protein VII precursor [Canine adenovirus 2]